MPELIERVAEAEIGDRYRVVTNEGHEIESVIQENDSHVRDEMRGRASVWILLSKK